MGLFRFGPRWPAIVPADSPLAGAVHLLDDRDRELEDHLTTKIGAAGAAPGWTGTAQPANLLVAVAKGAVSTNGSGVCTVTFGEPFPTGLLVCVATIAHTGNNILLSQTAGDAATATFTAIQADTGGVIASSTFNIQYIAVGW